MKKVLAGAVIALASMSTGCDKLKSAASQAGLSFGGDFEGEITMQMTRSSGASPTSLLFGIKKPKYRLDATGAPPTAGAALGMGQSTAFILDPPQKKGWALLPAQKKAFVIDFDKMKQMKSGMPGSSSGGAGKPSEPPPKIEKTGKKDVVAGYSCEIWYVTTNDGKRSEICAADGITWVDLGDLGWSSPELTVAAVASGANRFPLRVISGDTKLEATKVEKKKLDDARFVVPPDYQVIDIAQMMQNIPIPAFKK